MSNILDKAHPWPNGTMVKVESETLTINGKLGVIKGLQSNYPVVGYIYVVDFGDPIGNDYPYSCVCLPGGCIKPLPEQS